MSIYGAGLASPGGLYSQTCSQCHTVYASPGSSMVTWCPSCLNAQNTSIRPPTYTHTHTHTEQHNLLSMISMRLRCPEGTLSRFEHLHPVKSGDKVYTLVIQDGVAQIIEDEWGLFPSDGFITKLRLLEK
jgi:hypothetical protein